MAKRLEVFFINTGNLFVFNLGTVNAEHINNSTNRRYGTKRLTQR